MRFHYYYCLIIYELFFLQTLQPKKDMTNVEVKFDDDNTPNPEIEREKRQRIKRAEQSCIRDFLTEAIIMSQFNHPNIVKFVGITFEKNYRFIVTELLSGGDLKEFLRKNRPSVVCIQFEVELNSYTCLFIEFYTSLK